MAGMEEVPEWYHNGALLLGGRGLVVCGCKLVLAFLISCQRPHARLLPQAGEDLLA